MTTETITLDLGDAAVTENEEDVADEAVDGESAANSGKKKLDQYVKLMAGLRGNGRPILGW